MREFCFLAVFSLVYGYDSDRKKKKDSKKDFGDAQKTVPESGDGVAAQEQLGAYGGGPVVGAMHGQEGERGDREALQEVSNLE